MPYASRQEAVWRGACWQFVKSFTPVLNAFKEKVINGAISITSNFTSSRNTTEHLLLLVIHLGRLEEKSKN